MAETMFLSHHELSEECYYYCYYYYYKFILAY